MALELSVYCDRAKLPTAEQWSKAMKKDGFDVSFAGGLNWKKPHGGVTLNGEETHFELNLFRNDPDEDPPDPAVKFDSLVGFRFGSSGGEAALVAAAALSRLTKGYLYDPDTDAPLKAADAVAEAKRMLAPVAPKKKKFSWSWDDQRLRGAQWAAACERQLQQQVHRAYHRNATVGRANLIEFVRRDETTGLWHAQTVLRKMFQGEEEYNHSYAVLAAEIPDLGPASTPLTAGWRWSNQGLPRQLWEAKKLGLKRGRTSHASTTNFEQIVANARAAEAALFPLYAKIFTAAAPRVLELIAVAQRALESIGKKPTPLTAAKALGVDVKTFNRHRDACINLSVEGLRSPKRFAAIPANARDGCIVGHNIEIFWAARAQLPQIVETLRGLRGKRRR